ncbi:helix-turn-helix transcriptional regulator [Parasphaerochaeta coccoides]|uniref:Transcriptional regulator, AraC family n=1 Tax=Parasphaerochaeta coccoides (strain ATCC BAA-1237 / DSM 17374 / SPN1) TaxID=760011 RepID=F4GL01_PARC1|nr:AraC family transcriptional regulator [Parasphaerochaeta coccoides]AEC02341.1 transcriptional regulator, AraC family [Parasphaerochaeta coccoides DSM 17374]
MSDYLQRTLEEFHACTLLSVQAFDPVGRILGQFGLDGTEHAVRCPVRTQSISSVMEKLDQNKERSSYYIGSCANVQGPRDMRCGEVSFIVCKIDPRMPELGAFAFWPGRTMDGSFQETPVSVIEHLVGLLQNLARANLLGSTDEKTDVSSYGHHVRRAIAYLEQNLTINATLETASEELSLSKSYLCRIFRKETGITFSDYANALRITRSKILLAETNLHLLDIALTVGFNDQSYFNRVFKKTTGVTPLVFRREYAGAQAKNNVRIA